MASIRWTGVSVCVLHTQVPVFRYADWPRFLGLQLSHTLSGEIWPEYADCRIPKFDVASDALTKSLQFVAQPYPSPGKAAWSCNHCGEHLSDRVLRKEAVAHVRTM